MLFVLHVEVRKRGTAYLAATAECRTSEITCDFCKGEGQVSSEASDRWQRGDALRKARVERGLTLSEQAAILGVAPKALNDVEFGRRRLEELVDAVNGDSR